MILSEPYMWKEKNEESQITKESCEKKKVDNASSCVELC